MCRSTFVPTLLVALAGLPASAPAQWVEEPGRGWASLTAYHQDTRESFGIDGVKGDFPGGGHSVATQAFLTVAQGLLTGVDVWAQLSYQRLSFDDVTGTSTSTGVGDARLYARLNPILVVWGVPVPVALRGGVKLPVGDFDVGTSIIPLGDGQRDWELMLELGRSLYPRPFYLMGWAGYRWREARDARTDFGDERFFYVAVGGESGRFGFKLAADGWYGATPIINDVLAVGDEREMTRVSPTLLVGLGPGQLEVGVRRPVAGKRLPAGTDLVVGYFTRLGG